MDRTPLPNADFLHADRQALIGAVEALLPAMQNRADALDALPADAPAFPAEDIAALHEAGALRAPFPQRAGGLGMGTEPAGAAALAAVLRLIGRGNLAVGRLFEGHVNAVRLIARLGTPDQLRAAFDDAAAGRLIALWVTDPPGAGLAARGGMLHGGKAFCSGAGHASRAVIGVEGEGGARLAYVGTEGAAAAPLPRRMSGMRAASTGQVAFDGVALPGWIGRPGDYLVEPDFSCGAWRTSAVTCGGLEALVGLAVRRLVDRGRDNDPHQQARMGRALILRDTALLWLDRAAAAAETRPDLATADQVATVNLARIAIEQACLEAITLVERSLGLAAFLQPDPVERLRRDLATYLRQPAPDAVLTEAAAHEMRRMTAPGHGASHPGPARADPPRADPARPGIPEADQSRA